MYIYYIYSERVQSCPQKKKKTQRIGNLRMLRQNFPLDICVILFAVVVLSRLVAVVVVNWSDLVMCVCQSSARDLSRTEIEIHCGFHYCRTVQLYSHN